MIFEKPSMADYKRVEMAANEVKRAISALESDRWAQALAHKLAYLFGGLFGAGAS